MNSDARTVRGLNIATAVLSGILIFFAIAMLLFFAAAGSALNNPDVINEIVSDIQSGSSSGHGHSAFDGGEYYYYYDYSDLEGMSASDVQAIVGTTVTILLVLGVLFVACKIFALVASIIALRTVKNPQKIGLAFGMAIAAACVSFITVSPISTVLFAVSAVFMNRWRKTLEPASAPAYVAPGPTNEQASTAPQATQLTSSPQPNAQQPATPAPSASPVQPEASLPVNTAATAQPTVTLAQPGTQQPAQAAPAAQQPEQAAQPVQAAEQASPASANTAPTTENASVSTPSSADEAPATSATSPEASSKEQ